MTQQKDLENAVRLTESEEKQSYAPKGQTRWNGNYIKYLDQCLRMLVTDRSQLMAFDRTLCANLERLLLNSTETTGTETTVSKKQHDEFIDLLKKVGEP